MGLTESNDLMEEHWISNEDLDFEEEEEEEKEKEEKELDDNQLNEDELNEEKMWIDAISQEPKSSHLRNQLANHYFSQNRLKEAEFAYKAAINLDSKNTITHYDYAFMRHHQFYWSLAQLNISDSYKYGMEAKTHYAHVLKLEENDIETHYQLSLLYLTMLESTLIESIDNIQSPLAVTCVQYLENQNNGNNKVAMENYPVGRGINSPWHRDRIEIFQLCVRHLEITMDSCSEIDPVLFGTYITLSRLLYIQCIPNCFIYFTLTTEEKQNKLNSGIKYLKYALQINENDATLHHDLGLLLSHELICQYNDAIYHWLIAYKLDNNNSIYTQQIGYIYQYFTINYKKAIKYYNLSLSIKSNQSQIWNNLGILTAQNAKKQEDIIYATKCWRKCLLISPNHCEAHRNLGNIQWLHYYDKNKGEIHLQRAIAICKQVLYKMDKDQDEDQDEDEDESNGYNKYMKDKFFKFLAQCKSDYGGLLLMMYKYSIEAEKELNDAIHYDPNSISAHYYLGKYLFEEKKDYKAAITHLTKYISLETNKNIANRAHCHQILGEIEMSDLFQNYKQAQYHFGEAIKLSNDKLPKWALCKMHCGFADSIIKYQLNKLSQNANINIINQIRNKNKGYDYASTSTTDNNINSIIENIEIAKKHYRLILKLDKKYVSAPLGLATIFAKIEGKIKLADKHYNDSIKICQEKLLELYEKYQIELKKQNEDKKQQQIQKRKMLNVIHQNKMAKFQQLIDSKSEVIQQQQQQKEEEEEEEEEEEKKEEGEEKKEEEETKKNKKQKFNDSFGLNMLLIHEILSENVCYEYDISVIRIVKEMKEYIMYCIEGHLGFIDLIIMSCHNNKYKEALSHCMKILYLDNNNILAHCKKALLYFKFHQKNKAIQTAIHALKLAKEYDGKHNNKKGEKAKIVKNNLYIILKETSL